MNESFSVNYENNQDKNEGIKENNSSFYDSEEQVKQSYLKYQQLEGSKGLAIKQVNENINLKEGLEVKTLEETREQLNKEAMINEAKTMLYEKIGIDDNQNNNSTFENFIKGVIDGGILDNYDLAIQVYETNGKIILDGLEQLLSWEGLKNLASAIGEDIWTFFTGNAYERGKVSAELVLALITAGAGLTVNVAKKGVKLGIKEISKLRVNKERLVESSEVKNVINETNTKINEVLPKKELDINELAGIKTIDRQNLVEDLPRKDVEIRAITEFPELDIKKLIQIDIELENIIKNIKYNSFEKIEKLFQIYSEKKGNGYSIIDAYNEIDFNHIDIDKGSNCVGMSYLLKDKLGDLGVNSYLIRFDAGGLINNDYVVNGHSALIIPSKINGERHFTLADPGMLISKSITFADGKISKPIILDGRKYVIHTEVKDGLPYMLDIDSKKKLYFDPYNEWLNPNETLNRDIMRAIGDYKIVKQESGGKPVNAFITNIEGESIRLKIGGDKIDISYKEFLEIKENKELYELFSGVIRELGENPDDFFNINKEIIEGIGEYKDKIWAPSTKTIIDKK